MLTFNEHALNHLLQDPAGPLGRKLTLVSEQIAQNYDAQIGVIWENQDPSLKPNADYDIGVGDEGLRAIIGIPDSGRVADYMARKMERERDLKVGAIMQGWDNPL